MRSTISRSEMGIKWCQLPCQAGSNVLQWWLGECKRVRGQRLQQGKSTHTRRLGLQSTAYCFYREKGGERWNAEVNRRITKEKTEWAYQMSWIRLRSSKRQIGTKKADQKKKKERRQKNEDGNKVRMEQFQFPLLVLFTSHHNSICESYFVSLVSSARCNRSVITAIINSNNILITYDSNFLYFEYSFWRFQPWILP